LAWAERSTHTDYKKQIMTIESIEKQLTDRENIIDNMIGAKIGLERAEDITELKEEVERLRGLLKSRKISLMARIVAEEGYRGDGYVHYLRSLTDELESDEQWLQKVSEGNPTRAARHRDALAYAIAVSELQRPAPDKERLRRQKHILEDALEKLETETGYDPPKVEVRQRIHRHIKLIRAILDES
jgi:hypothetical protein